MKRCISLFCILGIVCMLCACDGSVRTPNTDSVEDVSKIDVPMGTVQISTALRDELRWYSDSAEVQVCISVKSMVPDNYLDALTYDGISASEYLQRSHALEGVDDDEASRYYRIYDSLRRNYFKELLGGLSYSGQKTSGAEMCLDYHYFYTVMTKSEILNLTCNHDEAFLVFSTVMYK